MSLRESDDFPQQQQQQQQPKTNRPQMRGPSADIEQLFSGLKPSINNQTFSEMDSLAPITGGGGGDDSIVSIASLKELQNTQLPKSSSKRRNRSEKNLNVVSLDI
jgi:hypothetical protein